jgi:hypothetical protein
VNKVARNETLKYQAASLDRASTACFAVGGIAPLSSIFAGATHTSNGRLFVAAIVVWLIVGVALNRMGAALLKGMEE